MRTRLAALALISIVCDLNIGHGATSPILTSGREAKDQDTPAPHKTLAASTAPLATENADTHPQPASQDCDGKAPASGSVTALLGKLAHASSAARGVQCPIPPVPDPPSELEHHP
jgi:hypothetical protein